MANATAVSAAVLAAVIHSTFVIERTYPVSPQRVFAALADPAKKQRWFAESEGKGVDSFEMDFRVGGRERTHFRMVGGPENREMSIINETTYLDIQPDRRVVLAYSMAFGEHRFSASLATFELRSKGTETELRFTEQAAFLEGGDGPERRKEGWEKLFDSLARFLSEQQA